MTQRLFIDSLDADLAAVEFLQERRQAFIERGLQPELCWHPHEGRSRTGVLWVSGRVSALALVTQDGRGRSILATVELPARATEAAASSITQLAGWPHEPEPGMSAEYAAGFRAAAALCEAALLEALRPESLAKTLTSSLYQASAPEQTAIAKQMTVYWRRLWRRRVPLTAKA